MTKKTQALEWLPIELADTKRKIIGASFLAQGMTFCGACVWESPEEYVSREGLDCDPQEYEGSWMTYWEDGGHIGIVTEVWPTHFFYPPTERPQPPKGDE